MNPKERDELVEWLKKFKNRAELIKLNHASFYQKLKYNYSVILDEALPNNIWTLEECKTDALKYKTKGEWQQARPGAYNAARRNGWYEECCRHMEVLRQKWDLESCKADALKYKTRIEWRNKGKGYDIAHRNRWIDKCCKHMGPSFSAKKPVKCIETNIVYESQNEAARQMGIHATSIRKVLIGKSNSTKGYTFKYVND